MVGRYMCWSTQGMEQCFLDPPKGQSGFRYAFIRLMGDMSGAVAVERRRGR